MSENGGFSEAELLVGEQASRENIIYNLYNMLFREDAYDTFFFYFAGHGLVDSFGTAFMAPSDFDPSKPYLYGIPMSHLSFILSKFHKSSTEKSKKVICTFVDCCHSDKLMDPLEARGMEEENEQQFGKVATEYLEAEGQVGLTSMDQDETSREQQFEGHVTKNGKHWHGIFSYNLIQGLEGTSFVGKIITLDNIIKYMNDQMRGSNQRVYSLVKGLGNITDLDLVIAPTGLDNYIRDLANKCSLIDKSTMLSLRDTGKYVVRLQKFKDKCKDYEGKMEQCTREITEQLEMFRTSAFSFIKTFFTDNEANRDRLKDIDPNLFKTLTKIPPENLSSFSNFMNTVGYRRCLLDALDSVITNPTNANPSSFIESCRDCFNYNHTPATNTAGGTKKIDTSMTTRGDS